MTTVVDKTQQFITKSKAKYNDLYDYSFVYYIRNDIKVTLLCTTHNIQFDQTPTLHMRGFCGCCCCRREKTKQTSILRYGVESTNSLDWVKAKKNNEYFNKHGYLHQSQNPETKEKIKQVRLLRTEEQKRKSGEKRMQTNLEKYEVEHASQWPETKEKIKQTRLLRTEEQKANSEQKRKEAWLLKTEDQIEASKTKRVQTCLERFGSHPQQNLEVKEKTRLSCVERFGVDNPRQSKIIQEKIKQTWITHYGVDNPQKAHCVRDRTAQTRLLKYGVRHYKQKNMIDILPLVEDYDWMVDQYITQNKTAIQIGSELGITDNTVGNHLRMLQIDIRKNHQSYVSKLWMESIIKEEGIIIEYEYQFDRLNKRSRADGYCTKTNTIYEFHGDYWHGNPSIYAPNFYNKITKTNMGELYQNTIDRENKIKELGYNLVVMWESDWNKINKPFLPHTINQPCTNLPKSL
ncbi:hypothetical protein M0R04_07405 [Candidatus Dojkabacteria bacterium]|jgi:hypothetical protein|nr:hypothetical protein [Candidatus Dojkabacteria bacterium]